MTDFKDQFIKLIEATEDPTAPIKVQDAYNAVNRLGVMIASISDQATVNQLMEKLTSAWPNDLIEEVCCKPEFVMALGGMFNGALKTWKDSLMEPKDVT